MFRRKLMQTTWLDRRLLLADPHGDDGDDGGSGGGAGGEGSGGDDGSAGGGVAAARRAAQGSENNGGDQGDGEGGEGGAGGEGEGSAGAGSEGRPEGLSDAFWDADKGEIKTDALIKAHNDTKAAHDRLVSDQKGKGGEAPKEAKEYFADNELVNDGNFRLPEGEIPKVQGVYPDGVPTDDPLLSGFADSAQKHGLTKAQFVGVVSDYLLMNEGLLPDALDIEAEISSLGDKGNDMVDEYVGWIDQLASPEFGVLNETDVQNMLDFGTTASEITTMRKIMAIARGDSNAPHILAGDNVGEGLPSYDEWYARMPSAVKENPTDADWQKWDEEGKKLFGEGPGGSSRPGMGMPASQGATGQRA